MQPLSDPSWAHWPLYHWPLSILASSRSKSHTIKTCWTKGYEPCMAASTHTLRLSSSFANASALVWPCKSNIKDGASWDFIADDLVVLYKFCTSPTGFVSLSSKRPSWDYYQKRMSFDLHPRRFWGGADFIDVPSFQSSQISSRYPFTFQGYYVNSSKATPSQ
jgi:hypothetical protein